jgi:hypothetical protein
MIISEQDQNIILKDSGRTIPDTSQKKLALHSDSAKVIDSVTALNEHAVILKQNEEYKTSDTTAVCNKNPVYDLIFFDPRNSNAGTGQDYSDRFPYNFIQINRKRAAEVTESLTRHLKEGKEISSRPFHDDWIIIIVLVSASLYAALSALYGKWFDEAKRFLFFRGIGDSSTRDKGALFHWKSTLANLVSFINIALFIYFTADNYNFTPFGISGLAFWLTALLIITISVSSRFIICHLAGRASGTDEAFGEYSVTIFQSYRFLGLILLILTILLSYTTLFPTKSLFITGFIIAAVTYLMRITRLLIIFLKRNISIFYLILYLCALEFLPVLILLKYLTDLF